VRNRARKAGAPDAGGGVCKLSCPRSRRAQHGPGTGFLRRYVAAPSVAVSAVNAGLDSGDGIVERARLERPALTALAGVDAGELPQAPAEQPSREATELPARVRDRQRVSFHAPRVSASARTGAPSGLWRADNSAVWIGGASRFNADAAHGRSVGRHCARHPLTPNSWSALLPGRAPVPPVGCGRLPHLVASS
jgi:hypothetical protein